MPKSTRRRPSLEALEPRLALSDAGPDTPVSISAMVSTDAGPSPIDPTFDPVSSPPVDAPWVALYDVVYLDVTPDDCLNLVVDDPFSPISLD